MDKQVIILAPRCRQVVTAKLESEKEHKLPYLVCIELVQIPMEGIPSPVLSHVSGTTHNGLMNRRHSRIVKLSDQLTARK
jgi:hypothetical protein